MGTAEVCNSFLSKLVKMLIYPSESVSVFNLHLNIWDSHQFRNLYEEGKVCLSLLGTWQGDKHEVWSAQRSSILQALISVQGLVLVKEPYGFHWLLRGPTTKLIHI